MSRTPWKILWHQASHGYVYVYIWIWMWRNFENEDRKMSSLLSRRVTSCGCIPMPFYVEVSSLCPDPCAGFALPRPFVRWNTGHCCGCIFPRAAFHLMQPDLLPLSVMSDRAWDSSWDSILDPVSRGGCPTMWAWVFVSQTSAVFSLGSILLGGWTLEKYPVGRGKAQALSCVYIIWGTFEPPP